MASHVEQLSWFRQMGEKVGFVNAASKTAKAAQNEEPRPWDAPADLREFRTFELADAMELGLCRELTTHFVDPVREGDERRMLVRRSADRQEYVLTTEQKEPLLVARRHGSEKRFDIYVAGEGDPPVALGPAFDMRVGSGDQWTLRSLRCEQCEQRATRASGPRDLLHVKHYREEVGSCQAWCMDVTVPTVLEDSRCAVWCPVCGDRAVDKLKTELTVRRPQWNEKRKLLSLDFFGRAKLASAKNIQLKLSGETVGTDASKVSLLFGKIESNTFVLDVKRPLGAVQAFAVALSTADWH